MTNVGQAKILRIQIGLWVLGIICVYIVLVSDAQQEVRTLAAFTGFFAFLTINGLHFLKIDDPDYLNQVTPYVAPSGMASLVLQLVLAAMLVERFGLAQIRLQTGVAAAQTVVTIVYFLGGIIIGMLNFAPAVYRFQDLRRRAKSARLIKQHARLRTFRALIEKFFLTIDVPNDADDLERRTPSEIRDLLRPILESQINISALSEIIMVDRWLADKLKEQEAADRPTLYVWGTVIAVFTASIFGIVASVLGVLDLLKSLTS